MPQDKSREAMSMAGGGPVNLQDAAALAACLNLPEALIARQPEYARELLFRERLQKDQNLADFASRDGARANIARDNWQAMEQIGMAFKNAGLYRKANEAWQKLPPEAKREWQEAGLPYPETARPGQIEQEAAKAGDEKGARPEGMDQPAQAAWLNDQINEQLEAANELPDDRELPPGNNPLPEQSVQEGVLADQALSAPEALDQPPNQPAPEQAVQAISGADISQQAISDAALPDQRAAGTAPGQLAGGNQLRRVISRKSDYFLDPFRNFANGWLDLLKGVMGSGQAAGELLTGPSSGLSRWFRNWVDTIEGWEFRTRRPDSFGGRLAQDLVRNVPQVMAQVGIALQSMGASTGFMFGHIFGNDYVRHRAMGISPRNAAFAGSVDAALQSALERVGIGYALGRGGGILGRALGRESVIGALPQMGAGKRAFLGGGLAAAAVEGATESIQHVPEYLTDFWARSSLYNYEISDRSRWTARQALDLANLQEGTREALYEGLIGSIIGGGVGSLHGYGRHRAKLRQEEEAYIAAQRERAAQVSQRLELQNALEEARKAALGSAQAGDYAGLTEMIAASIPGGSRYAWLAPEKLASILESRPDAAPDIARALNVPAAALPMMIEAGYDINMDLAPVLALPGDAGQILLDAARMEPDAPDFTEAALWDPDRALAEPANIFNQNEEDLAAFGADTLQREESRQISEVRSRLGQINRHINRLEREMTALGLTSLEAAGNAQMIEAHAMAMWKSYGVDPAAWLGTIRYEANREEEVFSPRAPEPGLHFQREESPETGIANTDLAAETPGQPVMAAGETEAASPYENMEGQPDLAAEMPGQPDMADRETDSPPEERIAQAAAALAGATVRGDISFHSGNPHDPLGQVVISKSARIVRLFRKRNVSTVPHEAAHIFVDDLMRVAVSDGQIALATFRNELSRRDRGADLVKEAESYLAKGDLAEGFRLFASESGRQARALAEEQKASAERAAQMKADGSYLNADNSFNPQYERLIMREAETGIEIASRAASVRLARQAARHIDALAQASADIKTLARAAGLDDSQLDTLLKNFEHAPSRELTDLQETAANGFVAWLAEGRAPSAKLQGFFCRMAEWLKRLYRDFTRLASPSPEVAQVFERLLASSDETSLLRNLEGMRSVEENFLANPHIDREDRKRLAELLSRIQTRFGNAIDKSLERRRNRYRKERVAVLHKVLGSEPFWQLVENVRFTRREILDYLGDDAGSRLFAAAPKILVAEGKRRQSLGEIVAASEYDTAAAMFADIYSRLAERGETRRGLAESLADEEIAAMARQDEAGHDLDGISDLKDYLNYADLALTRLLANMRGGTKREINRFIRQNTMSGAMINYYASQMLENMPWRQATAARLRQAVNRNLKKRNEMLERGRPDDLIGALSAMNNARVALAALDMLRKYAKNVDAFLGKTRKIRAFRAGKIPSLQTEALRKLFAAYGLGSMRATEDTSIAAGRSFQELVAEIAGDGGPATHLPVFEQWLLELRDPQGSGAARWQDLSWSELASLDNITSWLVKGGLDANAERQKSEAFACRATALECASAMRNLPPHQRPPAGSIRDNIQSFLEGAFAETDRLLWMARKADGLINLRGEASPGPLEEYVRKCWQAEENVKSWLDRAGKALEPHLRALAETRRRLEKKYGRNLNLNFDGILASPPQTWQRAYESDRYTVEMVLAMACHMGNRSNASRLLEGYRDRQNPEAFLNSMAMLLGSEVVEQATGAKPSDQYAGILTANDWKAIQGIWDALQMFWPDTVRAHREMFGFAPPEVPHTPLRFLSSDGQMVSIGGGYFPIRYDPDISDRVARWNAEEELFARNMSLFNVPAAKRGHTEQRTKRAPGLPVRLDLGMISEHISDAARFIEYGQLVRRFDRIISDPDFRAAYEDTYGKKDYAAIRPALAGLVRNESPHGTWEELVARCRPFMVMWGLAWNIKPAVMQLTAIFPAMADVGPKAILSGCAYMATHGMAAARQIWQASPYMLSRLENLDQDLRKRLAGFDGKRHISFQVGNYELTWEKFVDLGMKMIVACDAAATCAVWLGAYNMKLTELRNSNPLPPLAGIQHEPAPRPRIRLNPLSALNPLTDRLMAAGAETVMPRDPHHLEAARFADMIVKQSNPDYDAPDRSAFLRGKGVNSLINMFASATTLFASRARFLHVARTKGKFTLGQSFNENFFTHFLPAAAVCLGLALCQDWGGDGDKPGDIYSLGSRVFLDQFAMKIPGLGGVAANMLSGAITGENSYGRSGLRTVLDAPIQIGQSLGNAAGLVWKQQKATSEQKRAAIYAFLDAASFVSRVPVSRVTARAERGLEQRKKHQGTWLSPLLPR